MDGADGDALMPLEKGTSRGDMDERLDAMIAATGAMMAKADALTKRVEDLVMKVDK